MSDKINCPEFTLNPKLPVGVELSLCVLKSAICFCWIIVKSVLVVSGKSIVPKLISLTVSLSRLPVINTSNSACCFDVPSDCVFDAFLNAALNSTI